MTHILDLRRLFAEQRAAERARAINRNCLYIALIAAAFTVFAIVFGIRP